MPFNKQIRTWYTEFPELTWNPNNSIYSAKHNVTENSIWSSLEEVLHISREKDRNSQYRSIQNFPFWKLTDTWCSLKHLNFHINWNSFGSGIMSKRSTQYIKADLSFDQNNQLCKYYHFVARWRVKRTCILKIYYRSTRLESSYCFYLRSM